ncbi:MAG: DEAD/DEAH box helicase, partial [Bermanella sp.]
MGFEQLGLHEAITSTLVGLKYDEPTAVQQQVIPEALSGNDVLAGAQTGTGKTAAFVLPIIHRLLQNPRSTSSAVNVSALILAPTRELAIQVFKSVQ